MMRVGKASQMRYLRMKEPKSFPYLKQNIFQVNSSRSYKGKCVAEICAFISENIHFNGNSGTFSQCRDLEIPSTSFDANQFLSRKISKTSLLLFHEKKV